MSQRIALITRRIRLESRNRIRVTLGAGPQYEISPQEELYYAYGRWFNRYHSVIDFEMGLHAAGWTVVENRDHRGVVCEHELRFGCFSRPATAEYHLLGLLSGLHEWERVKPALARATNRGTQVPIDPRKLVPLGDILDATWR